MEDQRHENTTLTEEYSWANSGQTANVNQSTVVRSGTAMLTLLDNAAATTYTRNLGTNGTFEATTGEEGTWTIRLQLTDFSGDLNFRVETP